MKKLIAFCLLIVLSPACKKNRNCVCHTSYRRPQSQGFYSSNTKPMTEKMTEKQAQAVCDHEAENINAMYYNFDTNNGNYPSTATFVTTCGLQ